MTIGAVVISVITLGWATVKTVSGSSRCGETVRLALAAAPDISPAIDLTARQWTASKPKIGDKCVTVEVTSADPAEVAAAVAAQYDAVLNGVGRPSGRVKVPQIWIPDSTSWLRRLSAARADSVPPSALSVASSPVVLATPEPLVRVIAPNGGKLALTDLLKKMTTETSMRLGIVEPTRDAVGLTNLLAMRGAAGATGGDAQQATIAALRTLATGRSAVRADLLNRFPRGADAAALSAGLTAAALSEQAVLNYNAAEPPVRLAAVYVEPAPPSLDYPYAVLPGASPEVANAAGLFRGALGSGSFRNELAKAGLRAPDGSTGTGFPAGRGVSGNPVPPVGMPDANVIDGTLSTWTTVTAPARMLAVIDVSGSMALPVPNAGNATREQVTVEAARRGLGLFDDSWAVGLWVFSTLLDGNTDHRQLVPIGPLATQRQALLTALGTIQPKPNGETGLYDTILNAYKAVQNGWDAGRVNSVVLLTDGKNEDPNGLSLDQLIAELQKTIDPNRPIQVVALGIGPEVPQAELERITKTTGGGVFATEEPAKIGEIFLKAIALRSGTR